MVRLTAFIMILLVTAARAQKPPDQVFKKLFYDVQLSGIFRDSKTFVDCIPKRSAKKILKRYEKSGIHHDDTAALRRFILENFNLPPAGKNIFQTTNQDISKHIRQLWEVLKRERDKAVKGSSLLPLPNPYIVPGGRFREIYYWDSYFTMLGLIESGEDEMAENMVENFSFLLTKYGLIPNGNRTYYLSRSQPPFFSMMVELLSRSKGKIIIDKFHSSLSREYAYWNKNNVVLKEGIKLYCYQDTSGIPRQESYAEDLRTTATAYKKAIQFNAFIDRDSFEKRNYRHLRSAAASGWDFSTRWFKAGEDISTIRTADIIPVDLNCLLFHLETMVWKGNKDLSQEPDRKKRTEEIKKVFYNDSLGWYCDYDVTTGKSTGIPTLAGMFPLFLKLADSADVLRIVKFLENNFLRPGGVVTSLILSGEQWDAPNGWAPLQWITIQGLENYGYHELAKTIAERWHQLNADVFRRTGKLMEKYNVIDTHLEAGGGEYPSQDGFGWTNGVLIALINKYNLK